MFGVKTTTTLLCALLALGLVEGKPFRTVCPNTVVAAPQSYKYHCNFTSILGLPATPFAAFNTSSVEECRDLCLADPKCRVFSFDADFNYCPHYSVTIDKQHPLPGTFSTTAYWNRNCFSANYSRKPVLHDGRFERGFFNGWAVTLPSNGQGSATVKQPGDTGRFAAYVEVGMTTQDSEPNTVTLQQTFELCGGVTYHFHGSYFVDVPVAGTVNSTASRILLQPSIKVNLQEVGSSTFVVGHTLLPYSDGDPVGEWADLSVATFTVENDGAYNLTVETSTLWPAGAFAVTYDRFAVFSDSPIV